MTTGVTGDGTDPVALVEVVDSELPLPRRTRGKSGGCTIKITKLKLVWKKSTIQQVELLVFEQT